MQKQPNILFILIDDLGWKDLSCYGSSFYETPNIDKLAEGGMRFTNAYASCPVCSPTRASILSGKYPARVGMTQWIGGTSKGKLLDVPYLHYLPLEEKSLATSLKEGGYQTWHVGKWHLGDDDFFPEKHGFDVNIGGCHMGCPWNGYFSPWGIPTLAEASEGTYLTDHITDKAIDLIKNKDDKPFFMHLSHYAVHTPIEAPQKLVEKYEKKAKRLGLDKINPIQIGENFSCLNKQELHIERRVIQSEPTYAAMIENLDDNIGRVIKTLEDENILDDTLIIFTSDNGGLSTAEGSPTCNHPLAEGKGWNYEGGTRVCQIINWGDKVRAGSQSNENVTSTDFYPTILEAVGLPLNPEQHCDGVSLLPLIKEESKLDRDAIYWHYPHYANQGGTPASSLVSGRWKLIEFFEDNHLELYDLENDISESCNVAELHKDVTKKLHKKLQEWQKDVEAKIPEQNPNYEMERKVPKVANNAHE